MFLHCDCWLSSAHAGPVATLCAIARKRGQSCDKLRNRTWVLRAGIYTAKISEITAGVKKTTLQRWILLQGVYLVFCCCVCDKITGILEKLMIFACSVNAAIVRFLQGLSPWKAYDVSKGLKVARLAYILGLSAHAEGLYNCCESSVIVIFYWASIYWCQSMTNEKCVRYQVH